MLSRTLLLVFVLYITFIGGTAYPDLALVHRVVWHMVMSVSLITWMGIKLLKRQRLPQTPFDLLLAFYVFWLFLTTGFSHDPRVSLEAIWIFLLHVAGFYILVDLMQRQRWVFEALFITGGVVVLVSLTEVLSWYFGLQFAGFKQGWFEIGGFRDPIPPEIYRLSLVLNVSTILANYVAIILPLVLAWALSVRQKDYRQGLYMLLGGLFFVEVFTFSRGGWLATFASVGMLVLLQLRRSDRFSKWIRPNLILPIALLGMIAFGLVIMIYSARAERTRGDEGRVDMWQSAAEMIIDKPITGFGVRQFGIIFREYRDPTIAQDKLVAAHNLWLNTGAEIGLVGILLLFGLGAIFLRVWWKAWQAAPRYRQIRLEGVLAALTGFCVHSMVDMFALTATMLPILIGTAYVVADPHLPSSSQLSSIRRLLPVPIVLLTTVYLIWLMRLDLAQYQLLRSMQGIGNDDLEVALERAERARDLDPNLKLYDLHYAYVLGLWADENPTAYLEDAIHAHEETLHDNPSFDIGHANLAALYIQRGAEGDYQKAVDHFYKALEIYPRNTRLYLHYAQALELQALAEGRDPATDQDVLFNYAFALDGNVIFAQTDFWTADPRFTGRIAALEKFYTEAAPAEALLLAVYRDWEDRAEAALTRFDGQDPALEAFAEGEYAFYMLKDYERASVAYGRAIEAGIETQAATYAARAMANYQAGNKDAAEHDARTALFWDGSEGANANYVLALLEMDSRDVPLDDMAFNERLVASVTTQGLVQHYAAVGYARPAAFNYLPQLQTPGYWLPTYAPWLLLAERYAEDNDPETDPQKVYDAIRTQSPYLGFN